MGHKKHDHKDEPKPVDQPVQDQPVQDQPVEDESDDFST